jgi:hypothetical protein
VTAEFLWINIPLMALAFALWTGIPLWLVLRHPDRHPRETRAIPLYLRQRVVAQAGSGERPFQDKVREAVSSDRR